MALTMAGAPTATLEEAGLRSHLLRIITTVVDTRAPTLRTPNRDPSDGRPAITEVAREQPPTTGLVPAANIRTNRQLISRNTPRYQALHLTKAIAARRRAGRAGITAALGLRARRPRRRPPPQPHIAIVIDTTDARRVLLDLLRPRPWPASRG